MTLNLNVGDLAVNKADDRVSTFSPGKVYRVIRTFDHCHSPPMAVFDGVDNPGRQDNGWCMVSFRLATPEEVAAKRFQGGDWVAGGQAGTGQSAIKCVQSWIDSGCCGNWRHATPEEYRAAIDASPATQPQQEKKTVTKVEHSFKAGDRLLALEGVLPVNFNYPNSDISAGDLVTVEYVGESGEIALEESEWMHDAKHFELCAVERKFKAGDKVVALQGLKTAHLDRLSKWGKVYPGKQYTVKNSYPDGGHFDQDHPVISVEGDNHWYLSKHFELVAAPAALDAPLEDSQAGWDPPDAAQLLEKVEALESQLAVLGGAIARVAGDNLKQFRAIETNESAVRSNTLYVTAIQAALDELSAQPVPEPVPDLLLSNIFPPQPPLLYDRITKEGPYILLPDCTAKATIGRLQYYDGRKASKTPDQGCVEKWPETLEERPAHEPVPVPLPSGFVSLRHDTQHELADGGIAWGPPSLESHGSMPRGELVRPSWRSLLMAALLRPVHPVYSATAVFLSAWAVFMCGLVALQATS